MHPSEGSTLRALARMTSVLVACLCCAASARSAPASDGTVSATAARPNVVIVLADDLDVHSLSRMMTLGLMPKLKSNVVNPGTQFRNSFVTTSWCCPTKAS